MQPANNFALARRLEIENRFCAVDLRQCLAFAKQSPSATYHSMIVASNSEAPWAGKYSGILNARVSID